LHDLQLVFAACFKSAGVMENIAIMVREDEFVVDMMKATLQAISSRSAVTKERSMHAQPPL